MLEEVLNVCVVHLYFYARNHVLLVLYGTAIALMSSSEVGYVYMMLFLLSVKVPTYYSQ